MATLSFAAPDTFPEVAPGDALAGLIATAFALQSMPVQAGDVIVVAQKVVSKAEGRQRRLRDIAPSPRALQLALETGKDARVVELVLRESRALLRSRPGVLIVEDVRGFIVANAGIDASNVASDDYDSVLLLPADPDASAASLRDQLSQHFNVPLAVIINDSWGRAWRRGTIGTALGVAGMPGLLDLRGTLDRQGRTLVTTEVGLADELAAGASVLMGQAGEGRPVVLVRGVPYARRDGNGRELLRPVELDLFR